MTDIASEEIGEEPSRDAAAYNQPMTADGIAYPAARRILVNAFIIAFFGIAAVIMLSKHDHELPENFVKFEPFRNAYIYPWFFDFLQFDQSWQMFAAKREKGKGKYSRDNEHIVMLITFADGSTRMEEFYYLNPRNQLEKWQHGKMLLIWYRLRTYGTKDYARYFPSVCRYIARAYNDPTNPPVRVAITDNWSPIPDPNLSGDGKDASKSPNLPKRADLPNDTNHFKIFVYDVKPTDLQ